MPKRLQRTPCCLLCFILSIPSQPAQNTGFDPCTILPRSHSSSLICNPTLEIESSFPEGASIGVYGGRAPKELNLDAQAVVWCVWKVSAALFSGVPKVQPAQSSLGLTLKGASIYKKLGERVLSHECKYMGAVRA